MPHFFDTNTLLHFASREVDKADRISDLLERGGWISVQVLNEATRVLRHKWNYGWEPVHQVLAEFRSLLQIVSLDIETHSLGLALAERYKIAVFDSMIVAAALRCQCDTLYSEDMHHGLVVDGRLTIVNPYRDAA